MRTEDEAVGEEFDIAQLQVTSITYRVKREPPGAVGHERVVMAIDDDQGFRQDNWVHWQGIGRWDATATNRCQVRRAAVVRVRIGRNKPGGK